LLNAGALEGVRELKLNQCSITAIGIRKLLDSDGLDKLESLEIERNPIHFDDVWPACEEKLPGLLFLQLPDGIFMELPLE